LLVHHQHHRTLLLLPGLAAPSKHAPARKSLSLLTM
jgi:hypothetical protein